MMKENGGVPQRQDSNTGADPFSLQGTTIVTSSQKRRMKENATRPNGTKTDRCQCDKGKSSQAPPREKSKGRKNQGVEERQFLRVLGRLRGVRGTLARKKFSLRTGVKKKGECKEGPGCRKKIKQIEELAGIRREEKKWARNRSFEKRRGQNRNRLSRCLVEQHSGIQSEKNSRNPEFNWGLQGESYFFWCGGGSKKKDINQGT